MPRALTDRALNFARGDGSWEVPATRDASTVVLLRTNGDGTVSTYLMRRVSTMAFAAGMHVFPGGSVDQDDFSVDIPWQTEPDDAARMNATSDLARALVVCAVRELFEETGVLIAVDAAGRIPARDEEWETDRLAVQESASALAGVLRRRGLAIDASLLPLWTHWVTPEVETKRFDVRFFVTFLPEGQGAHDVSGEADHVRWIEPAEAMHAYAAGELTMLPPTAATIADLIEFVDIAAVLASAPGRDVRPLLPRPRLTDEDDVVWELVDARDGSVVVSLPSEPAGSEVLGVHGS